MKKNSIKTLGIVVAIVLTTALTGCQKKEVAVSSEENVVVASAVNSVSNEESKSRLNTEQIKEALSANTEKEETNEEKSVLVKTNNEEEQPKVIVEKNEEVKQETNQEETTVKTNKQSTNKAANQSSASETSKEAPAQESAAPVQEEAPAPASDPVAEAQAIVNSTYDSASRVIALTNLYRAQNGLGSLTYDPTLTQIAQTRAEEIITCWSHTRPDGTNATALASEYGLSYRILGENLGEYQSSADQVCNDWMNSPGHRANLLNGSFGRIGVGIATDAEGYLYWVQIFAN